MKRMLIMLLITASLSSCSKREEIIETREEYEEFKMADEYGNTIKPTEDEEFIINMKIRRKNFII